MTESNASKNELLEKIARLEKRLQDLESQPDGGRLHRPGESLGELYELGELHDLGHFARNISHDLNNLLVGILGNAGLALMDLSPHSPSRPLIKEVEAAAQRAADLANQMTTFSDSLAAGSPPREPGRSLEPTTPVPTAPVETSEPSIAWRGDGLILVVDDEAMVRSLARRILEKFGFEVMTADDGHRALDIFASHAPEFVAVLLDVTMPELDGVEVFRKMRGLRPDIRVILSSGLREREATRQVEEEGLAGFLPKPYLPIELIAKLREVLAS